MAYVIAKFAPALALLAFTMQGCEGPDVPWSAKITMGEKCHKKVESFTTDEEATDLKIQGCASLNQTKLKKFGVDNCKEVYHDTLYYLISVECKAVAAFMAGSACSADGSFKAKDCLSAIDDAVSGFIPHSPEMPMDDGLEPFMGLVAACSENVSGLVKGSNFGKWSKAICADVTSPSKKDKLGVTDDDCKDYFQNKLRDVGVIACIGSVFQRGDFPPDADYVTHDWLLQSADDFGHAVNVSSFQELENVVEGMLMMMGMSSDPLPDGRLRLFQSLRVWQQRRRPHRWSPITIIASASSALALVALAGVARRIHGSREQLSTEDGTSPLQREMEPLY